MRHLRLALRALFRTPFITTVAIASLALGIGANTAIFSLFDQMVLRALPVSEPERLVNLNAPGPKSGHSSSDNAGTGDAVFSYPMFRDLQREQTVFTGLAAHRRFSANLAYEGQTVSGEGMLVSGSYFPVLGLRPALGRLFGPEDDRAIGGHPLVVLSHDYWRARFDSSPTVLHETLVVNGQALTVVGVAPRGFRGTTLGSRPQVFVPITMRGEMAPGWEGFENRRSHWAYLFARLLPGRSLAEAETGVNVPYHAIVNEVEAPLQSGLSDQTLVLFKTKRLTLDRGWRGQSRVHDRAQGPFALLLSISGIVLLIACANVANLLLVRGTGRATEMAVRVSLGASRGQLVGQLLTESCILAVIGGLGGLLVAGWTLDLMLSLLPSGPAVVSAQLHPSVLLFTAALSLGTGLVFGLFPALHATRPDVVSSLKGQAGQPAGGRGASRLRTGLATAQIALATALLVSAGLFAKSLLNVSRVDLGLRVDSLITFGLSPDLNGYSSAQSRTLFERLEDELAAEPGITAVTAARVPLIAGSNRSTNVTVEGFDAGLDADTDSSQNAVGPGFFNTLGIPLMSGREFTPADVDGAPKVVVVNEAFARKFSLERDAVGKRMREGLGERLDLDLEIIGLVQDAKYSEVKAAIPPQHFVPYRQNDHIGAIHFYVRTTVGPDLALAAIPGIVSRLDPTLPIEELRTMEAQVRDNIAMDRLISTLSAAFAFLATLLAAVGLYGVLAYTVAQRTREIGVRMALGAAGARVRGMVVGQVCRMTVVGGVLGVMAAIALGRVAQSLLFELESHDPVVLIGAVAALALVSLTAGYLPARRASRVDPMRALRYE